MKPYIIKFGIAFLFIAVFAIIFNSCKKNDRTVNNKEADDTRANAIKATIERYGHVTAPIIYQPRQPASTISYKDANGNLIMYGGSQYGRTNNGICGQYDCNSAPNPSDLYVTSTLEYVKWYYKCGTGHDMTAIWKVSTPYTLLDEDPNNAGNYSFGHIRIKSGSTVLITSGDLTIDNAHIVSLGADPNCSANTLYDVSYTWYNVADTYFPGNTIECSFTIYNNCPITNYNLTVGYTFGATYTNQNDVFTHPCDRTDQAWVNPPSSGNQTYANVTGAYTLCTPPSGFTGTTHHQVEYRAVTSSTSILWDDQTSAPHGGVAVGTTSPEIPVIDAYGGTVINCLLMTLHSGKWLIRYRNRYTGCAPNNPGIGDSWIDPNTGRSNYVTEYWNLQ